MFGTEWLSGISSFIAKILLVQTHPLLMVVVTLVAIILLMLRIQKPRPSYIVKVIAIVLLIWSSINAGWFLRDNDWGIDEVNQERQKQIEYLQNKTSRR